MPDGLSALCRVGLGPLPAALEHASSVRARVFTRKGHEMTVDARLVRRDGRWLVYDIAVESISLVGNYRAQFDRVIRKSGYAELARLIRVKRDQLLKSKRAAAN